MKDQKPSEWIEQEAQKVMRQNGADPNDSFVYLGATFQGIINYLDQQHEQNK